MVSSVSLETSGCARTDTNRLQKETGSIPHTSTTRTKVRVHAVRGTESSRRLTDRLGEHSKDLRGIEATGDLFARPVLYRLCTTLPSSRIEHHDAASLQHPDVLLPGGVLPQGRVHHRDSHDWNT